MIKFPLFLNGALVDNGRAMTKAAGVLAGVAMDAATAAGDIIRIARGI